YLTATRCTHVPSTLPLHDALPILVDDDRATRRIGVGPVHQEERREPGHGDAQVRVRAVPPGVAERPPAGAGDLHREHEAGRAKRSEEHTSELQSRSDLVCRLLLEK